MINFANIGNCPVNASDRCLSFNNTRNCGLVYNRMFQSPTGRFKLDLTIFHGSVCSTINTCGDMVHAWQIDAQSCNVSSPPFELASSSQSRCPAASSCYPASYGGTFGRSSSGHFSTESFQFVTNTTNVRMGITQYLGTSGAFYLSRMVLARERVMTPRPVPTLPSPTPSAPTPPGAPSPVPLTAPQPTPPVTASPPTPSTTTTTTTITTVTTMTPQPTTTTTTTTTVTKTTSIETTTPASSTTVCKPIDCEWAAWSSWFCPVTCGGGTATRSRSIHVESSCGGESCKGQDVETMDQCAPLPCPVDCEVSQWSDWSMCGASCGPKALESRTRKVEKPAANGGMPCPASLNDSRACGPACCPENCIVSNWSGWSACSVTCGRGLLTRTRSVSRPAQCDGTCLDDLSESTQCNAPSQCTLPAVDCDISAWSAWSKCSASCGAATKTRARVVRTEAANGGQPCPIDLSEVDLCNSPSCTTTTMATTTTTTAPPTQTSVGANGEVRVIASTDLAIAGGRNESLSVVIGGVGIRVTANPNNAMLQDLPGAGLGVYSSAHGDDGKSGTMRLRAGLEVVFRFKVPVAIKRILLGAWESGDRGMLVCSEPGKKRQIASTTNLALRNADTSFEAETADGFTRYAVLALNNSDFSILAFDFVVVERRTSGPRTTTTSVLPSTSALPTTVANTTTNSDDQSNAIMPPSDGLAPLTLGLIIGGALLCLLLTVIIVIGVIVARRRRSRPSPYDDDGGRALSGTIRAGNQKSDEMASARFDDMEASSLRGSTMLVRSNEYASTSTMPFSAPATHEYGVAPPVSNPVTNTLRVSLSSTTSIYGAAPPIADEIPPPTPGTLRRVPPPPPSSNYGAAPPSASNYGVAPPLEPTPGTLRKARPPPPPGGEYGQAPSLP